MTRREVRTPIADANVVELGNRIWRKQVLPHTTINYHGRQIQFDKQYCDEVAAAFRAGAYPAVPFQFADADNRHTNDPSRTRGEVIGMESTDDGLVATLRLSEEADALVREYPNFGVSVRVREDYERPDGQRYPRAMQHLLGTWDPKLAVQQPWQAVDMSNDEPGTEVIDLTQHDESEEQMTASVAGVDLADLIARGVISVEDPAALDAAGVDWTGDAGDQADDQADAGDDDGEGTDGTDDEDEGNARWPLDADGHPDIEAMTDEQFAAWSLDISGSDDDETDHTGDGTDATYQDLDDPDDYGHVPTNEQYGAGAVDQYQAGGEDADAVTAASNAYQGALELSQNGDDGYRAGYDAAVVELSGENAQMRERLDASDYARERDRIVQQYGIPPYLVDLAQPLLQGQGRDVVLSNGDTADAGTVVRGFIDGLGQAMDRLGINMLDLSQSTGQVLTGSGEIDAADNAERRQKAARIAANIY